jgi:hypothetical protein
MLNVHIANYPLNAARIFERKRRKGNVELIGEAKLIYNHGQLSSDSIMGEVINLRFVQSEFD